jgi:3-hydroxybutyryl-CoA dehydrogenase
MVVGVDLVVEAATENVELKLNIFKQLNDACSHDTFSNTSSISLLKLERLWHIRTRYRNAFYESCANYETGEIIRGYNTSDEVTKHHDTQRNWEKPC